jgi:multicomponent Na+:H+ antiporter subunit C
MNLLGISFSNLVYWLSAVLLLIGLHGMLTKPNLVRKLMAMNIFQVAVITFYVPLAWKSGATAPIETAAIAASEVASYINPLPHALMLTAIVVSVSTTGVALALLIRIHRRYGTLEEPELLAILREGE